MSTLVEAARQALEYIERHAIIDGIHVRDALRTAIAETEKQENSGPINDGWQLSVSEGHSGRGVYAYMTEYPEEGAVFLMPIEAAEKQELVEFDHSLGADRYKVVKGAFWWHIRIGDGTSNVGKFHSKLAAEDMALKLLTAYRDGAWTQRNTTPPAAPVQEPVAWINPLHSDQLADKPIPNWTPLYTAPPQRQPPKFPTMLRKMWSGAEVQEWINEHWHAAQRQPSMVVSQECAERGCMAHDDRVDGAGVVVGQRQPLTDDEINALQSRRPDAGWSFIDCARAIEQAHGITGEKK